MSTIILDEWHCRLIEVARLVVFDPISTLVRGHWREWLPPYWKVWEMIAGGITLPVGFVDLGRPVVVSGFLRGPDADFRMGMVGLMYSRGHVRWTISWNLGRVLRLDGAVQYDWDRYEMGETKLYTGLRDGGTQWDSGFEHLVRPAEIAAGTPA